MKWRKSTSRAKLKAANQEERIHMWKENLKNLLGKSPKVTDKPIPKIINYQLNIKLGEFNQEELYVVLTKIKSRKDAGLDEIPPEVWKTRNSTTQYKEMNKRLYLPFPKERWPRNYKELLIYNNLSSITAKIYNALLLNSIEPEIEKILWKNQNGFQSYWSATMQILTIHWILEGIRPKKLEVTLLLVDFSKAFDSIHRKGGANTSSLCSPPKSCCYHNNAL